MAPSTASTPGPDVFVSYARGDRAFVERFRQALVDRGRTVWVDLEDILPTEDWWKKIRRGIESADHFVFVLSPSSASSEVCRRELAHAVENHKRLIPVLYREVDAGAVPRELADRQWLRFLAADSFDVALDLVTKAFDTDPEWVNAHTRWQVRAIEWEGAGRDRSLLLRGRELGDAEGWLLGAGRPREPRPTPLQNQFIVTSRRGATRRQRLALAIVSAGLVVAAGLAALAWIQRAEALRQARVALGRQLGAEAGLMTRPNDLERAALLAIEGMKRVPTPDAHRVLRDAVVLLPDRVAIMEHGDAVNAVVFTPDGARVASASSDKTIHVWDLDGREVSRMVHDGAVKALAFSPDGRALASASDDRTARVWDATSGHELVRAVHKGSVATIAFSADGRLIATGSFDRTARVWEAATGRLVATLSHGDVVNRVVFSPDGRLLATASGFPSDVAKQRDDSARVWEVSTGRELLRLPHGQSVRDVVFSPDGGMLASASFDGSARLWQLPGGRLVQRFEHEAGVECVAFSPDGHYLGAGQGAFIFSGTGRTAKVWDTRSGREVARLPHGDDVKRLAFSADGSFLATASSDGVARVWTIPAGEEVLRLGPGSDATTHDVAMAPDAKTFATAHANGVAAIWRMPARLLRVRVAHAALVRDGAFDADGRTLVTAGDDAIATVTDLAKGSTRRWPFEPVAVPAFTVVGNGQYVATIREKLVRVVSTATGSEVMVARHEAPVQRLALSSGGGLLATAVGGHEVAVWRVPAGTPVARLRHDETLANVLANLWFDDAGRRLAVATEHGGLHVWDPNEGRKLARALKLRLEVFAVKTPADLSGAFKAAVKGRADAMLVNENSMLTAQRVKLAELGIKNRLPVVGSLRLSAEAGLLMSYGVDLPHVTQRIATQVDRILKGAGPGDLPFEEPTKFELVINLKTAKALGLTIPPSLLARADQVIE